MHGQRSLTLSSANPALAHEQKQTPISTIPAGATGSGRWRQDSKLEAQGQTLSIVSGWMRCRRAAEGAPGTAGKREATVLVHCGSAYRLVRGEGGVAGHKEVEPRGGDERGDEADEVIVHVSGVAQGGGAG